jgi:hypothetical protein
MSSEAEIERLATLAFSDTVQGMDSDPVEPDMEIGFETVIIEVVRPIHTGAESD